MTHEIKNFELKSNTVFCSCGQNHPATIKNYRKDGKLVTVLRVDTTTNICLSCNKVWNSQMCWRNGCAYHSY